MAPSPLFLFPELGSLLTSPGFVQLIFAEPELSGVDGASVELDAENNVPLSSLELLMVAFHLEGRRGNTDIDKTSY